MSAILSHRFETFYAKHGIRSPLEAKPIRAGRNSEVQRLSNRDGQWILKHYFHHPNDQRDRLGTEFGFLQFFNQSDLTSLPHAIGMDRGLNCALYSLLPGIRPQSIETTHLNQAAQFILALQQYCHANDAAQLPLAADACLSWQDHLDLIALRIERLLQTGTNTDVKKDANHFIRDALIPAWKRLLHEMADIVSTEQRQTLLKANERILSPSDFGFHNALEHEQGLAFVDFEYAGWDDPAKLICDFICQPEVPVTPEQGQYFCDVLLTGLSDDSVIAHRVVHLLPIHRLKWCCILLNELKNDDLQRRLHAGIDANDLLEIQLKKAKTYFQNHLT